MADSEIALKENKWEVKNSWGSGMECWLIGWIWLNPQRALLAWKAVKEDVDDQQEYGTKISRKQWRIIIWQRDYHDDHGIPVRKWWDYLNKFS